MQGKCQKYKANGDVRTMRSVLFSCYKSVYYGKYILQSNIVWPFPNALNKMYMREQNAFYYIVIDFLYIFT